MGKRAEIFCVVLRSLRLDLTLLLLCELLKTDSTTEMAVSIPE